MTLRHRDRGSLNLELALAMPVLLMLTVGSIFFGIMQSNRATLQSGAAMGARSLSYYGGDYQEVSQDIIEEISSRFAGDVGSVVVSISFIDENGDPYTREFLVRDGTAGATGIPAGAGSRMVVTATYPDYPISVPFVMNTAGDLVGAAVTRNAAP